MMYEWATRVVPITEKPLFYWYPMSLFTLEVACPHNKQIAQVHTRAFDTNPPVVALLLKLKRLIICLLQPITSDYLYNSCSYQYYFQS